MTSIDEMRGRPLAARVHARKTELELALADLGTEESPTRRELEMALATVASLTTGDVDRPSDAVASQLSAWLERNKHLGVKSGPLAPAEQPTDPGLS